jgi:four helix bundle protein
MADYRNLEVWQAAHRLTLDVYRATVAYPKEEMYGLVTQTRRAVASIPTNLAEGSGRGSDDDYARFVRFASGSANEVEYQLLLAKDLGYLDEQMWSPLASEVSRVRSMLSRLNQTLKR